MLLLTGTTDLVTVTTSAAGSIAVHASFVDNNAGTITPGRTNTPLISTAATTTVVASPSAGVQRNVKKLNLNNVSGSVANLVTINHTDGTTVIALWDGTLAAGESVEMGEEGEFTYYAADGTIKAASTGGAGAFTTLTASSTVTLSPANANVAISPTGTGTVTVSPAGVLTLGTAAATTTLLGNLSATGSNQTVTLSPTGTGTVAISPASTVTISPTGALTVNPTAASTINNASIGATTRSTGAFTLIGAGGASNAAAYITTIAGTATVAPMTLTGGTNLTTAAAGAVENDAINFYCTTNTTDGRARIPLEQTFKLTANGTAFNTISNFFGTTSNISLVASALYEIDIELYFTKTGAEAVTFTFTNSAAPTSMNIHAEFSPLTGVTATPTANLSADVVASVTAAQTVVTGTLTTAVNHYARFKIWLANGTGTSLKIQASCATASGITPLRGSRWKSMRMPTGNVGTFAA